MSERQAIELTDLDALEASEAPDLYAAILAFVDQPDPEPEGDVPDDAFTFAALTAALRQAGGQWDKKQRQIQPGEAWKRYLNQSPELVAPRVRLAELIVKLYEKQTPAARRALLVLCREAPLRYGIWGGLKRVYKRAEADLDAELIGALAPRFETYASGDVRMGTLVYLRRRVWRFLRQLGKASPELYPQFAAEVLRNYPAGSQTWSSWAASHIMSHTAKKWGAPVGLPREKRFRAPYLEAWKLRPDPLLTLLETAQSDMAAEFAILGLRELFPKQEVAVEWLARLASRPLSSAHEFLVDTLMGSPDLHQSKLKARGLHDAVLELLLSPSAKARTYAVEYARAHATDMPAEKLCDLLDRGGSYADTTAFAFSVLSSRPVRTLGVRIVARMLSASASQKWAAKVLDEEFEKKDYDQGFYVDMLFGSANQSNWVRNYITLKLNAQDRPVSFWLGVLDDPRLEGNSSVVEYAFGHLQKLSLAKVPADWLLGALSREDIGWRLLRWLGAATELPPGMDVERLKGLVFDPDKRQVAFNLLGNPKLVSPSSLGLGWLLALARRADTSLNEWAHRYLLEHMRPEHFAEGAPDPEAGTARLFALATGAKEPEAVRTFAQTYLRCQHPKLGREQPETRQLGIKPSLKHEDYSFERVWPALFDLRADVRRFAVAITRVELRRWKAHTRVYELAESSAKEVRKIAYDALTQAGERHADPELALLPEELDAAQIFTMTESRKRSSRDVAMELIRKHYRLIGGAEKLGWLMQSADREVRMFAVRLLWEKHRPRGLPASWKPKQGSIENAGAFEDAEALRSLLRRLLYMVPRGRSMEALEGSRTKKQSGSQAKKSVIELVCEMGIRDKAFAELVAPVLAEFAGSAAKGEWQSSLSALVTLRAAHGLELGGAL
jgi:hypothetical protein